jgi:hypothetical protein
MIRAVNLFRNAVLEEARFVREAEEIEPRLNSAVPFEGVKKISPEDLPYQRTMGPFTLGKFQGRFLHTFFRIDVPALPDWAVNRTRSGKAVLPLPRQLSGGRCVRGRKKQAP